MHQLFTTCSFARRAGPMLIYAIPLPSSQFCDHNAADGIEVKQWLQRLRCCDGFINQWFATNYGQTHFNFIHSVHSMLSTHFELSTHSVPLFSMLSIDGAEVLTTHCDGITTHSLSLNCALWQRSDDRRSVVRSFAHSFIHCEFNSNPKSQLSRSHSLTHSHFTSLHFTSQIVTI